MSVVYTRTARVLHWLTAVLLLVLFGLGLSMTELLEDGDFKLRVYSWHEWTGVTVFGLTGARFWWRLRHPPPPIDLPLLERITMGAVHAAIYLVLIVQPITGWIMNSAFGFSLVYLGVLPVPDLVAEDHDLARRFQWWHERLAILLFLLFLAHMGGVLMNHYGRRKEILGRMWRRRRLIEDRQ
jgi:cytochrome b561